MIEEYPTEGAQASELAQQIWLILAAHAVMKNTLYYENLADLMGRPGQWHILGNYLKIIENYCRKNGLPPLTCIIVRKDTGRPGNGSDIDCRVFDYKWFRLKSPEVKELETVRQEIKNRIPDELNP